MQTIHTDVAIIGAGSAGMVAYKAARKHTEQVISIESGPYGTTCARVGCMPSKLLIAAAEARYRALQAPLFGVHPQSVIVDGPAVMQRVRQERDRFVQYSLDDVAEWPEAQKLHGHARFVAPGIVQVDEHTQVHARSIVIATGSSPQIPADLHAQLGDRLIINDDLFNWHDLPQSVAVMGTGVIGLELAHALHDLGVRVRLLGRSGKVGPTTDPEIAQECKSLIAEHLPSHLQISQLSGARTATGVRLRYIRHEASGQIDTEEDFDFLLMATGRAPNLHGLNLAAAGIAVNEQGLPHFDADTRQIEGHPVFLAGDVNQVHPILHAATDDGFAAGNNAATWPAVQPFTRRASLGIVFSRPQIALVGPSHRQLRATHPDLREGRASFRNQGRTSIEGKNQGLLKVYGDPHTGLFLGAEMVGPAAEHLGHLLAWALQQEQTVEQMLACPFYHPTIEEGLRTALQKLRSALKA